MNVKPRVHWEGAYFVLHSLALVNREICKRLMFDDTLSLGIVPYETAPGFVIDQDLVSLQNCIVTTDCPADITIRHQWPPKWSAPKTGKWVLFQPWEFGAIPREWYIPMKYWADEIWVPSSYNKACYVKAGIPEHKIQVIPLGVDTSTFHPNVPKTELQTEKTFKFLFVGGTIFRKGIDILLNAYLSEFSKKDDVCLVIKDFGVNSFYQGMTSEQLIETYKRDPDCPEIIYLISDLSAPDLAGLYKACDCLVHPYRGEGFGLPIVESMACGTPAMIPEIGAARDFCNSETSFIVPAILETYKNKKIGQYDTLGRPWWIKTDLVELRKSLRFVYEHQHVARQKGVQASQFIASCFTWDHTVAAVKNRIQAIASKQVNKLKNERDILDEEIKRGMYLQVTGSKEEALDTFLGILDTYPHSIEPRYNAGVVCALNTDFTQALKHFEILSGIMGKQSAIFQGQVWSYIGLCHTCLKQFTDAIEALEKATRLNSDTLVEAIRCYELLIHDLGKSEDSSHLLSEVYHRLSVAYFAIGNDFEARKMAEAALQSDDSRPDFTHSHQVIKDRISLTKEKYKDILLGKKNGTPFDIIWQSPIFNATGYAEESKSFLAAMQPYPVRIHLISTDGVSKNELTGSAERMFLMRLMQDQQQQPLFHIQSAPASQFAIPRAPISIGRTMFETDSLPPQWLDRLKRLSDIWVPSHFSRNIFIQSGIDPTKVFVVPGTMDFEKYNPENVGPYSLPGHKSFNFLSVFDWNKRKGWDILFRAYLQEFDSTEDVCLIIKITKLLELNADPRGEIKNVVRQLGLTRTPAISIIDSPLTEEKMVQLYAASDAFVLSSRGEGWGRPYMEAMAMRLPTIGTRWSGNTEFMNDTNSFLINVEKLTSIDSSIPYFGRFEGHKWAEPSELHLRQLMREVFENRDNARMVGERARNDLISKFSKDIIGARMFGRLEELVRRYYE